MSEVVFPIKLNDAYTCQGTDAEGRYLTFDDLLSEGEKVPTYADDEGNCWGPFGTVVMLGDGLWIIADEPQPGTT